MVSSVDNPRENKFNVTKIFLSHLEKFVDIHFEYFRVDEVLA